MDLEKRIQAFVQLGLFFKQWVDQKTQTQFHTLNKDFYDSFFTVSKRAEQENRWFIQDNILFAIRSWSEVLTYDNLKQWLDPYTFSETSKKVGVIQAGNIPLVGFHDFLSVLISNHIFVGKASSKDKVLSLFISDLLIAIEPEFKERILWVDRMSDIEAVIATGSDNTARYFEHYFGKYPHVIRKNRSSWAILTGNETEEELQLLAEDIFRYYGLGCRNISKLWVPDNYDFTKFWEAIYSYKWVYNNNKYANNYDYNSSVYLMSQIPHLSNNFFILKEDISSHSPLSVCFYEHYSNINTVKERIETSKNQIQCLLSHIDDVTIAMPFGTAQKPALWDYADNVDTIHFLTHL